MFGPVPRINAIVQLDGVIPIVTAWKRRVAIIAGALAVSRGVSKYAEKHAAALVDEAFDFFDAVVEGRVMAYATTLGDTE